MLGLSGCPQQTRLDGDGADTVGNGRAGATTLNGADGSDGVNGAEGMDGRDGADGFDGVDGADGFDGVNGADGEDGANGADGLSSLVRVRQEDGSATCPAGGSVVESGIDRNRDSVLDDEEVDSSALICNGSDGADGADAIDQEEVARRGERCLLESVDDVLQLACENGTHELETEALTPEVATASSVAGGWTPAHAAWEDQAGWMSEMNSGNPEWLQYDFGGPVVLTRVHAFAVNGRHGYRPMIQGSNDGTSWTDIHALGQEGTGRAPWTGYLEIDESISSATAFRYVRLYSQPMPFVYYAWLGFDGAKM
jgi:hypothetical protein